jgi:hypothetical protein
VHHWYPGTRTFYRLILAALFCCSLSPVVGVESAELPELPRVFVDTEVVETAGATIEVPSGGDLQAALYAAQPGDVIVLEAGAVYHGPFMLPRKAGDEWITVTSSRAVELLPGQRVAPSDAPMMAVLEGGHPSVVQTEPGAHHYRLVGLEIRPTANTFMFNIVDVGSDARDPADIPHHLIFDRCYLHGDGAQGSRRAVAMNGAHVAVVESYLADLKEERNDSQAIVGWSGPGPFKIANNHLEAAGENVMFGGADPWLPGLVPSDIEIRDNDVTRPWAWWREHLDHDGTQWVVKNLLELKNARRVLIQGNRFSRHWPDAQQGFAIVLTPRNQDGTAPWSRVEDVAFVDNELRDISSGLNVAAYDDGHPESTLARVLIRNNLFAGLGATVAAGRAFQLLNGPPDVTIEHNTIAHGPTTNSFLMFDGQETGRGLVVRNNVLSHGLYGMFGVGVGSGSAALAAYAPDSIFEGNLVYGFDPEALGWIQSNYPGGNTYVPGVAEVAAVDVRHAGTGPGAHGVAPKTKGGEAKSLALGEPAKAAKSAALPPSVPSSGSTVQQASGSAIVGPTWNASTPAAAVDTAECGSKFFDDCREAHNRDGAVSSQDGSADDAWRPVSRQAEEPIGLTPAAELPGNVPAPDAAMVSDSDGSLREVAGEPTLTPGDHGEGESVGAETSEPTLSSATSVPPVLAANHHGRALTSEIAPR